MLRRLEHISHGAETFANDLTRAFLPAGAGPVGQFGAVTAREAAPRRRFLQANEPVLFATVTPESDRSAPFRRSDLESNLIELSGEAATPPAARTYLLSPRLRRSSRGEFNIVEGDAPVDDRTTRRATPLSGLWRRAGERAGARRLPGLPLDRRLDRWRR